MHAWYLLDCLVTIENNYISDTVDNSDIFLLSLNKSQQHGGICAGLISAPGFTFLTALATLCH